MYDLVKQFCGFFLLHSLHTQFAHIEHLAVVMLAFRLTGRIVWISAVYNSVGGRNPPSLRVTLTFFRRQPWRFLSLCSLDLII